MRDVVRKNAAFNSPVASKAQTVKFRIISGLAQKNFVTEGRQRSQVAGEFQEGLRAYNSEVSIVRVVKLCKLLQES